MADSLYQQFDEHFKPKIKEKEMTSYGGNAILEPNNLSKLRKEFAGYIELDSETNQRIPFVYAGFISDHDVYSSSAKQFSRNVDCLEIKVDKNIAQIIPFACRKDIEQGSIEIAGYELPFKRYSFLFSIDPAKEYEWRLQKFYIEDPAKKVFEEITPVRITPISGIFATLFNDIKAGFLKGQKLFSEI